MLTTPHPPAGQPADVPAGGRGRPRRASYDVLVVGGGPAGSTAAHRLARQGFSVLLAEREQFPRFHVGESLLPSNMPLLDELGIRPRLGDIPHSRKVGVEFALGHEQSSVRLRFADGLVPGLDETINVVRADFDRLLADLAAEAGAELLTEAPVSAVHRLEPQAVEAKVAGRTIRARYLIDASGQSTFLGKRLGLRRVIPDLRKVAYTGHFTGVHHWPGDEAGHPAIVMMRDAWFWIIRLDAHRTSVGMVADRELAARSGAAAGDLLQWGIARCPMVRRRLAHAHLLPERGVLADFSYRCAPFAGPGYFLVGDAATFVDPIFSTGICLAMLSADEAAKQITAIERGSRSPDRALRAYRRFVERTSEPFFRLVRSYYRHPFRELLLSVEAPLAIHRAVLSLLAGAVYPRVPLAVRWRMALFYACLRLQQRRTLVPRRPARALAEMEPGRLPWTDGRAGLATAAAGSG